MFNQVHFFSYSSYFSNIRLSKLSNDYDNICIKEKLTPQTTIKSFHSFFAGKSFVDWNSQNSNIFSVIVDQARRHEKSQLHGTYQLAMYHSTSEFSR